MEPNALWIHALAHILLGKPRKSDVSAFDAPISGKRDNASRMFPTCAV